MDNPSLIKAIREHAIQNYNSGGWDVLVECWEDQDILDLLGTTRTLEPALQKLEDMLKVHDDIRRDIQSA